MLVRLSRAGNHGSSIPGRAGSCEAATAERAVAGDSRLFVPGSLSPGCTRGCLKLLGCSCCCWPGNQELISYEMLGSLC